MSTISESQLHLEPTALGVRAIGPWLQAATDHLDADVAAAVFPRAELAVHEACMNVIDHANLVTGSAIEVILELRDECLTVRIRDCGDEVELPTAATPRDPLSERGHGLKIIRSLVNEVSYRRIGSTNELELRIDIGRTP
ncbi:MAG: ATP-binding protein [Rhodococcus sp. (in: high G+C Gram-positive bacteria)]